MNKTWPWWMSGAIALLIISLCALLPMLAMIHQAGAIDWNAVFSDIYTQRVILFSLKQATLSTLLSVVCALPLALAIAHKPKFWGRAVMVNIFSLSLVIPTIVAIYGIVAVFGKTGWANELLTTLSLPSFSIYGLNGILVAHVFFNMPLMARVLLVNLEGIPTENWRLAKQLGLSPISIFNFIEWPAIRGLLPSLALLVFTLCFTSFAIVMTLGGGPRATTIEVAIYQALRFDFDIKLAVALGLTQLSVCILLMLLSTLSKNNSALQFDSHDLSTQKRSAHDSRFISSFWKGTRWELFHISIILTAGIFILSPLLALLTSAFNDKLLAVLTHHTTVDAFFNTILVAMVSALTSFCLAILLLSSSRYLRVRLNYERSGQWLQLCGNVILVLPPLVLGTGLFLLLRPYADVFSLALLLVVIINSLMALPFILRILEGPVMRSSKQHDKLIQSLGIQGISRWKIIDWPQLRKPIGLSLAVAATLSAGDLSAIALFGSEKIRTLPLLLYQRIGSYRLAEASVTAGLLLLLCLLLFVLIQRAVGGAHHART